MAKAASHNPQNNLHPSTQHTAAENRIHYERHRPEETVLYQLVQEHIEAFIAQVEAETGSSLLDFLKDEFDAFLEWSVLVHGFLHLRCAAFLGFRAYQLGVFCSSGCLRSTLSTARSVVGI